MFSLGGTVDITVHQILKNGHLKELDRSSGGDWGGISVDMAFKQALAEIVTEGVLESYCHKYPGDFIELLREFEFKKRIYRESNQFITLKVPITFIKECAETLGTDLSSLTNKSRFNNHFFWKLGKVRIDMPTFKGFFQPAFDGIINHVKELLSSPKLKNVKKILMVGGFSESPLLQDVIRKTFSDCQVIVPEEAGLAVLRGAIVFGHVPSTISIRIARYTYGVKMNTEFDPQRHMESKKRKINGVEYCTDIFDRYVETGQQVEFNEDHFERFYVPLTSDQTEIAFIIYNSEERNPFYIDNCQMLGTCFIVVPRGKQDRTVAVQMMFGSTELIVRATVIQTGHVCATHIDLINM